MVTMSPDATVSTGFSAALKWPICTVCGLGINVCSAPRAADNPATAVAATSTARREQMAVIVNLPSQMTDVR